MTTVSSATSPSREAQAYLDGVGASLADLPVDDRTDLLDELATHLDELATEGDAPLVSRLGSPQDYAAELRAWIVVALLTWFAQPHWWRSLVVVPDVGPGALSVLVLLAAIVVSAQVGRRGRLGTVPGRWFVATLNLVALVGFWPVLLTLNEAVLNGSYSYYYGEREQAYEVPAEGVYASKRQVTNLFAYDAAGQPLTDIRLYDQKGRSLELGDDREIRQTIDVAGNPVRNAFPYRYLGGDAGSALDGVAPPLLVVPPLLGVPTALPSPTPTPTPSPSSKSGKP